MRSLQQQQQLQARQQQHGLRAGRLLLLQLVDLLLPSVL
jgi:hypothetical protein